MKRLLTLIILLLAACRVPNAAPTPAAFTATATTLPTAAVATPTPAPTDAATAVSPATSTAAPAEAPTAAPQPTATSQPTATATPDSVTFAVIGDYGFAGPAEADVAALVFDWTPEIIITTGDNNYPDGAAASIDHNIGQYYAAFIYPYAGNYPAATRVATMQNRFFPTLGNHDYYTAGAQPYFDYFELPGNERYYEFVWGPVHFFALNTDGQEPDGIGVNSAQAAWLQERMAASTTPWQVVYMHVPPYSSGHHGSFPALQWPFAAWGADAVLAGHDHTYERLLVEDIPYFVNGVGGYPAIYAFNTILPESVVRFRDDYGAMRVRASETEMQFEFFTRRGDLVDSYSVTR